MCVYVCLFLCVCVCAFKKEKRLASALGDLCVQCRVSSPVKVGLGPGGGSFRKGGLEPRFPVLLVYICRYAVDILCGNINIYSI